MWRRLASGLALLVVAAGVGAAVGCAVEGDGEDASDNAISGVAFNKNHLLDDAALLDDRALTEEQIQSFLDRTPFGTESPLAEYRDGSGKAAATILHDAAVAAGINPLELLVRVQMEYALVGGAGTAAPEAGATSDDGDAAPADPDAADPIVAKGLETKADPMVKEKIAQAFNCGQAAGFEAQATCASKSIARAMQTLAAGSEASGGWKIGLKATTADKLTVTPENAATAALYSYTPYVGEGGGGAKGTAGVSGHVFLWQSFVKAVRYKGPSCAVPSRDGGDDGGAVAACGECSPSRMSACSATGKGAACLPTRVCGCTKDSECGGVSSGRVCNLQTSACQAGCRGTGNACPLGQTCSSTDDSAGTCTGEILDAGASDDDAGVDAGVKTKPDAGASSDDDGSGHKTSSGNSSGSGSHSGSSSSSSGEDDALGDAGADGGTSSGGGKKGCSAAGASPDMATYGVFMAWLGWGAARRRRARRPRR